MGKRYQVFVSSTFSDLAEERRGVFNSLLDIDCIVAGMEFFPAMDQEQFEYIKHVIDDSDYYLLIIGGRYGTITESGISFTEQEYDYAVQTGKPVIALLHSNPGTISVNKSDSDPVLAERLQSFRQKVSAGRLVKFWENISEVKEKAVVALVHAIKVFPAVGWIRASETIGVESLSEINTLLKENAHLKQELADSNRGVITTIPDIAGLDEKMTFHLSYVVSNFRRGISSITHRETISITWRSLFARLAPRLQQITPQFTAYNILKSVVSEFRESYLSDIISNLSLEHTESDIAFIQCETLGLIIGKEIPLKNGGLALCYKLTDAGYSFMVKENVIRTTSISE